ncbi:hypothetical protein ACE6H2_007710 [Prunus campanulata]
MQGHGKCLKLFLAFALVLLQYAQGREVDHSQRDTNVTIRCIERERQALLAFKHGLLVDEDNLLSSWSSEAPKQDCCKWIGVYCNNQTGHVIGLDLSYEVISEDYLQDFSMNFISGSIPECLTNLNTLAQKGNPSLNISHSYVMSKRRWEDIYEDDATFMWKGGMQTYKSTLGLVKRIDLSSNKLTGEIPSEITHLVGLVSLNLSRNQLTGQITPEIGNLQLLDSLDFSRNHIDGRIPTSLAQIDRLGFLDLSYNNLSGKIPVGTQLQGFDPSFYAGNLQLCGPPLKRMCADEVEKGPSEQTDFFNQEDKDELITLGFYISIGLGFAAGFWGVCGTLIFSRSWRYAYLKFLNGLNDWLFVRIALLKRQLKDA